MRVHANAKLGPAGRLALVRKIESGYSLRAAAAESSVSVATAHRWWHRSRRGVTEQATGEWAQDRSSRPRRSPRRLDADEQQRICEPVGARTWVRAGWPGSRAGRGRRSGRCSRGTVCRVDGAGERQTFRRYEWAQPGALLHMDVKRLARFEKPGHWATGGQRSEHVRSRGAGWAYSARRHRRPQPLPYVEQHDHEDAETNARTLERALALLRRARPARPASGDDRQRERSTGSRRFQAS